MVTGLDYAFDPISMTFENISKEAMVRAVRVKSVLKGKLQKHLSFEEKKVVEEPTVDTPTINETETIVESNLKDKLDALVAQGKVETKVRRMVLYTKDLAAKSERVMNKTLGTKPFPVEETVANVEETSAVEVPTDKVGVVSDNWDSVPSTENMEKVEENIKTPNVEESREADMEATQTLEIPNFELPTFENNEKEEVPNEIEKEPKNFELPPMDFLKPEVNEPNEIQREEKEKPELNFDFLSSLEKEKPIEQSFGYNNLSDMPSFEMNVEPKIEIDDVPSQSAVVAKARKISNLLSEANSKVSDLQSKVGSLEVKYSEAKEKNHVLESFVKDVVKENTRLVSENTQLKGEKQKLEDSIIIVTENAKSENAVQAKNHVDEVSRLNDEIAILKEDHRAEKERMEIEFKEKLRAEDERHKKAMRALYATISETLVEPTSIDDEMTKVA